MQPIPEGMSQGMRGVLNGGLLYGGPLIVCETRECDLAKCTKHDLRIHEIVSMWSPYEETCVNVENGFGFGPIIVHMEDNGQIGTVCSAGGLAE